MRSVNLIPAGRREAKARQRHLRHRGAVLVAYAIAAACAYAACHVYDDQNDAAVLGEARAEIDRLGAARLEMRSLRHQIATCQRRLALARTLTRHPDWSLLLAMLAENVSDDLFLERCVLRPVEDAATDRAEGEPDAGGPGQDEALRHPEEYRLEVSGLARTQSAVSRFVLRLEKSGLFREVRLVQSRRRTFLDGKAVGFHVRCTLGGKRRGSA